jgi:hypothetical protein
MTIHPLPQPSPTFDDLWKIWIGMGRRVGKGQAKVLYEQIINGGLNTTNIVDSTRIAVSWQATPEEIHAGALAYSKWIIRSDTETQYTKTLPVWLNQGRWMDYE